jgi:ribosome-binding protein aMBF1 (putative translation factor)
VSRAIDVQAIAAKSRAKVSPDDRKHVDAMLAEDLRTLHLAIAVRDARTSAGLTQAQLSAISGITQAELSRIESARFSPRVSTLFKLADALKTTFEIGQPIAVTGAKQLALIG